MENKFCWLETSTNTCCLILIRTWITKPLPLTRFLAIWVMIGVCPLLTRGSPLPFQLPPPPTFVDCLIPDFRRISYICRLLDSGHRSISYLLHFILNCHTYHTQTQIQTQINVDCRLGDLAKSCLISRVLQFVSPATKGRRFWPRLP